MKPEEVSREIYWPNPFPESLPIAAYLQENTTNDDTIAILGSEPQIFFYAKRRSATGFIYMYPLMEQHPFAEEMQKRMIGQIEDKKPKFILFVRNQLSWLQQGKSSSLLFQWFENYRNTFYTRKGLVQIFGDTTLYQWENTENINPRTPYWIEILQRN
jgi:hypothetical protein